MISNIEQAIQFLGASAQGTATAEGQQAFAAWCARAEEQELEQVLLAYEAMLVNGHGVDDLDEETEQELIRLIEARLDRQEALEQVVPIRQTAGRNWYQWWAAAAVLVVLLAGGYWWYQQKATPAVQMADGRYKNDIAPGYNRAVLTLGDGATVTLDSAQSGQVAQQGSINIQSQKGQLIYQGNNSQPTVAINTLSTPRGGQYQLLLPDGTRVWLNAASSLTFPTFFAGEEREVSLTGEAYFEVAKNPQHPFRVKMNGSEVMVLGTHFNIMAYDNEVSRNTTLLEGSVQVVHHGNIHVLKPGEQARERDGAVTVTPANVVEAVAWKNGLFRFKNCDITAVMRQIARWYDIEVVYEGKMPEKTFTGMISRMENVSAVLQFLELTKAVHFTIEGNRVTVMP